MTHKINNVTLLTISLMVYLFLLGCAKDEFENEQPLKLLYKTYKNGKISECKHNGQTVYSTELNSEDAGGALFDQNGEHIGACDYAWRNVDSICLELTECEVIYRVKNNIWGQPAVDKYKLGK